MPAPRNPWIARQRIICSIDEANPHSKLAKVKPEAEIANSNRVPSARDRNPDNGIAITSAIRYEVWTHDTSLELADRPAWISESDAETNWMSRIDMNIPNTMMRNANSRRGAMRSEDAAAAFIITGGAVAASTMICSGQNVMAIGCAPPAASKLLRLDHGRRVEVSVAVGILGAVAGIDGGVNRHAGAQQVLPGGVLRHAKPDREPLHDLGEVAGGVVRWQQREHRAGRRGDAVDDAFEFAMAIGIHRDRHRLAWTDALELRLLEVGVDKDVIERHYIAEPLPHHHEVAGVDQTVGERPLDRRAHRREVEVALSLGKRYLQFRKLRAGFRLLRLGHFDIVARRVIGGLRR